MGRASKRMQRKAKMELKEQVTVEILPEEIYTAVDIAKGYKEEGKYNEAMETLLSTFEKYGVKNITAYEVAEVYYSSGDYEKTATWCENTMNVDSSYIPTYLLLTKLALLQDQQDNALALLEKSCHIAGGDMTLYSETLLELMQIIYIDYEEELVQTKYSFLWQCINKIATQVAATIEESVDNEEHLTSDYTENAANLEDEQADDVDDVFTDSMEITDKANPYDQVQKDIMEMQVSLRKKLELCQQTASEYYLRGDLQGALAMLNLGIIIDHTDELILKNMGFILQKLGRRGEALQCFAKLKHIDLMVIDAKQN